MIRFETGAAGFVAVPFVLGYRDGESNYGGLILSDGEIPCSVPKDELC